MTEQLPFERVHCELENVPALSDVKVTVPVGTMGVPAPVSLTVTVHVVLVSGEIVLGLQVTETDTGLGVTWMFVECEPSPWMASPG